MPARGLGILAGMPVVTREPDTPGAQPAQEARPAEEDELVEAELLVEEISIDGMCGVY